MQHKKKLAAAAALTIAVGATAIAFPRYVRARVNAEAERRGLVVEIAAVRPAWMAVRLVGVSVRTKSGDAFDAAIDEVRIDVGSDRAPRAVHVRGGSVDVRSSAAVAAWRTDARAPSAHGTPLPIDVEGLVVRSAEHGVEARGVALSREDGRTTVTADDASFAHDGIAFAIHAARVDFDGAVPKRARASSVSISATSPNAPSRDASIASPAASATASSLVTLLAMPLPVLRTKATELASRLAARVQCDVDVDALSVTLPEYDVTLGPGAFTLAHAPDRVMLTFATMPGAASTPLALRAEAPTGARAGEGDAVLTLEGGPVALARLGLRDGNASLVDVEHATLEGRATVTLPASGAELRFDADLRALSVAIQNRRLAKEVVRGVDLGVRAKGSLDTRHVLSLEDTTFTVGALRTDVKGTLDASAAPARVLAKLAIAIPTADCQAMLDSAPSALVPTIAGTRLEGTFGAHVKIAFDSKKIDDLGLDYAIDDRCRVVSVPPHLARERFTRPFMHRFYSAKGEVREALTGPGTPGWTPLGAMSRFLPVAVVMTEDGGMFRRAGFNHAQIRYAIVTDLKERRFARGASTLTMQLAKNLFLSRDKVLGRKIEEVVLTEYLSQHFSKEQILELYLNVVELGPDLYGVAAASAHYFGKGPASLTLPESLFLAALLPSPVKLHGLKSPHGLPDAYVASIAHLVDLAHDSHLISDTDRDEAKAQPITFR